MSALRSQGRRLALQTLYALEFPEPGGLVEILNSAAPRAPQEVKDFALEIVNGVATTRAQLDTAIDSALEHWRLERIHPVERNILRIGLYELNYRPDIPAHVILNEAVDLARRFGDEEAWKLINGILDRLGKERLEGTASAGPESAASSS
ncbi:MAG: transcription antitermination factor NusB [Candidatus Omnitrophica bacterium]|nr:Transcription antitermination protein NusB [bacterium]NUN95817.1 transcription antitermination factor NusB [Candidatus Omnitrophota bacterium]